MAMASADGKLPFKTKAACERRRRALFRERCARRVSIEFRVPNDASFVGLLVLAVADGGRTAMKLKYGVDMHFIYGEVLPLRSVGLTELSPTMTTTTTTTTTMMMMIMMMMIMRIMVIVVGAAASLCRLK